MISLKRMTMRRRDRPPPPRARGGRWTAPPGPRAILTALAMSASRSTRPDDVDADEDDARARAGARASRTVRTLKPREVRSRFVAFSQQPARIRRVQHIVCALLPVRSNSVWPAGRFLTELEPIGRILVELLELLK